MHAMILLGLKEEAHCSPPTGPAGKKKSGINDKKINPRKFRLSFWGFSWSVWGLAAHLHFFFSGGGIFFFEFSPSKIGEKSGPPSLLLSPAK